MSDKARSIVYCFLGLGSFGFTFYGLALALSLTATSKHYSSDLWLCSAISVVFVFVGMMHFYTAYAFGFGRVIEVAGSMNSAALIQGGRTVLEGGLRRLGAAIKVNYRFYAKGERNSRQLRFPGSGVSPGYQSGSFNQVCAGRYQDSSVEPIIAIATTQ